MQKIDFNNDTPSQDNTGILQNYNEIKLTIDNKEDEDVKIEKEVIELVEIFNTVQDLVVNQKGIINVIEDSIDNVNEYAVITQNDLDEIEKIKNNMANKKTIIYRSFQIFEMDHLFFLCGSALGNRKPPSPTPPRGSFFPDTTFPSQMKSEG